VKEFLLNWTTLKNFAAAEAGMQVDDDDDDVADHSAGP
jgi:hypothetical protein